MKKFWHEFFIRGFIAMGFGPIVLAIIYFALSASGEASETAMSSAAMGIISIALLAFLAGGMTAVYLCERLSLFFAALIHGAVLYGGYLATYIINGWFSDGFMPIVIFSGVFVLGYAVIWGIIYFSSIRSAKSINGQIFGQ